MTQGPGTTGAQPGRRQAPRPAGAEPARSAPPARLTPAERAASGKAARTIAALESHEMFDPPPGRPDPVSLLQGQAASRMPDLVPVRYARMLVSPFAYFRGAALPMASDLAGLPVTGITVQACGDAHLCNFGIFGSPERHLTFDVNDFDETLPGPWEWDVKRLAASLEVAARENEFARKERLAIVLAAARTYREAMRGFAQMSNLEVWYARIDVEEARALLESRLTRKQRKTWDSAQARARTQDSMRDLRRLTRSVDGTPRIIADPPLITPLDDLLPAAADTEGTMPQIQALVAKYRRSLETDRRSLLEQYQITDIARKVVGVGSVGTRCWILLMLGRDAADPLFLQVKEAQRSILSRAGRASKFANEGQRVVVGQRLMQASSDIFLGWVRNIAGIDGEPHDFYVRQLRDWKISLDIGAMLPDGMRLYGQLCAWTLARAHARSGDRIAIAAYLGRSNQFERAIGRFAVAYADQNERDYRSLIEAADSGQVIAAPGA